MTQKLQAIYERGILRPLGPLELREQQLVTLTVSDGDDPGRADSLLRNLEAQADESVDVRDVRTALTKIPGSMTEAFHQERNQRG